LTETRETPDMTRLLCGLALLLVLPLAMAAKPAVFATDEGAIRGYDPVAYFTAAAPTRGSDQFTASWQGATFYFASAENLKLFKADPAAYAPQYGGYCAYAVSKGATATTVPEAWTIVDGKLYLNYSLGIKQRWSGDVPGNIRAANSNWPAVLER
jgi:YHS domain-containing protein